MVSVRKERHTQRHSVASMRTNQVCLSRCITRRLTATVAGSVHVSGGLSHVHSRDPLPPLLVQSPSDRTTTLMAQAQALYACANKVCRWHTVLKKQGPDTRQYDRTVCALYPITHHHSSVPLHCSHSLSHTYALDRVESGSQRVEGTEIAACSCGSAWVERRHVAATFCASNDTLSPALPVHTPCVHQAMQHPLGHAHPSLHEY